MDHPKKKNISGLTCGKPINFKVEYAWIDDNSCLKHTQKIFGAIIKNKVQHDIFPTYTTPREKKATQI